ncbi:MAG: hypothetical protein DRJ15_16825, partial [Bacteroidetes bacterium]
PATGAEFQNKKVSDAAVRINNLDKLKVETEERLRSAQNSNAPTSQIEKELSEIDARIKKTRDNLSETKAKTKDADGVESETNTDYNDEVDSLLKTEAMKDKLRSMTTEGVIEQAGVFANIVTQLEDSGLNTTDAEAIASNVTELYASSDDKEVFADNFNEILKGEISVYEAKKREASADTIPEPGDDSAFTEQDWVDFNKAMERSSTNESEIDVGPGNDLLAEVNSDIASEAAASDALDEAALEERMGTMTSVDEAMLAEELFGDATTVEELDDTTVEALDKRSDAAIQTNIASDNPVVAKQALETKQNKTAEKRAESVAETTVSLPETELKTRPTNDTATYDKTIPYQKIRTNENKVKWQVDESNPNSAISKYKEARSAILRDGFSDALQTDMADLETSVSMAFDQTINDLKDLQGKKAPRTVKLDSALNKIHIATQRLNDFHSKMSASKNPQTLSSATIATTEDYNVPKVAEDNANLDEIPQGTKDQIATILDSLTMTELNDEFLNNDSVFAKEDMEAALDRKLAPPEAKKNVIREAVQKKEKAKTTKTLEAALSGDTNTSVVEAVAVDNSERIAEIDEKLSKIADDPRYDNLVSKLEKERMTLTAPQAIETLRQADPIKEEANTLATDIETDEWSENVEVSNGDINMLSDDTDYSLTGVIGASKVQGALGAQQSAIRLTQQGYSPLQIWKETNWFYEPKTKDWKFEIDDSKMEILRSPTNNAIAFDNLNNLESVPLNRIINHPILFKMYPNLANFLVKKDSHLNSNGKLSILNKTISLSYGTMTPATQDTLLHEIQHYIQSVENFSRGGVPSQFTETEIDSYINQNIDAFSDKISLLTAAKEIATGISIKLPSIDPSIRAEASSIAENESLDLISSSLSHYNSMYKKYSNYIELLDAPEASQEDGLYSQLAFTMYWNLLGEMEARDTSYRR